MWWKEIYVDICTYEIICAHVEKFKQTQPILPTTYGCKGGGLARSLDWRGLASTAVFAPNQG